MSVPELYGFLCSSLNDFSGMRRHNKLEHVGLGTVHGSCTAVATLQSSHLLRWKNLKWFWEVQKTRKSVLGSFVINSQLHCITHIYYECSLRQESCDVIMNSAQPNQSQDRKYKAEGLTLPHSSALSQLWNLMYPFTHAVLTNTMDIVWITHAETHFQYQFQYCCINNTSWPHRLMAVYFFIAVQFIFFMQLLLLP